MTRDNIQELFDEPYRLWSDSERENTARLAQDDPEIAADLAFVEALGKLPPAALVGEPPTSDAVFLVALRDRIGARHTSWVGSKLVGFRAWATAMAAGVLLVAGIYFGGQGGSPEADDWMAAGIENEELIMSGGDWIPTNGDLDDVDTQTMAASLDLEDSPELWYPDDGDVPITDQLLELTPESLEEVLLELESTSFFENEGDRYES